MVRLATVDFGLSDNWRKENISGGGRAPLDQRPGSMQRRRIRAILIPWNARHREAEIWPKWKPVVLQAHSYPKLHANHISAVVSDTLSYGYANNYIYQT